MNSEHRHSTTESRHSFQGKPIGVGRTHAATDVGVVIVTYQSARTIRRCLDLLLASDPVVRIVVIDNASDDETLDLLRDFAERHDRVVTVVRNSDNRGFAAACNQGASALATPWVAFVNPDCYVESWRCRASGAARRAAMPAPACSAWTWWTKMARPDPAARRRDPSLRELLDRRGRRDDLYLGRDPQAVLQPVEAISGALMLMPVGLFLQLGGFDEGFRMHVEDLDLCRRTRDAGYEVLVANDITVLHVGGESSSGAAVLGRVAEALSLWRYFRKFERRRTPGLR